MAILKNIKCTVSIAQGDEFQEYQDQSISDTEEQVTRYIEATAADGKPFQVNYQVLPEHDFGDTHTHLYYKLYIDGKDIQQYRVTPPHYRYGSVGAVVDIKHEDGAKVEITRKLVFNTLDIGRLVPEDALTAEDSPKLKNLGEIKVLVYRSNLTIQKRNSSTSTTGSGNSSENALEEIKVDEKTIKGKDITHQILFGEQTERRLPLSPPSEYTERHTLFDFEPYATFLFLYRSKRALQSLALIPYTRPATPEISETQVKPIPPPPPALPSLTEMTQGEMVKELVRLRALVPKPETRRNMKRKMKFEGQIPSSSTRSSSVASTATIMGEEESSSKSSRRKKIKIDKVADDGDGSSGSQPRSSSPWSEQGPGVDAEVIDLTED